MTTAQQRIHELKIRQMYVGSSLVCKLNHVNSELWYSIYAWIDQGKEDDKILVLFSKYNNEDPEDLFQLALKELGVKKIKLGKPHLDISQRSLT